MPDNLTAADLVLRTDTTAQPSGPFPTGNAGANKLWLPLWSGEVINAYDQYNVFENLITTKTLTGGFSYEFPVTGTVALNAAWNAGEELIGGDSSSTTFKVALDKRPMAAHFETDNVDLLVTQWDYRSELARQAGLTLANTRDRQLIMGLAAASAVPQLGSDPRGLAAAAFQKPARISASVLAQNCTDVEALVVLQEIENYLVTCQENDVPVENVYCAVRPKVFQVIRALGIPRSSFSAITNAGVVGTSGVVAATNNFTNYPLFGGGSENGGLGAPLSMGMNSLMDSLDYMGVKIIKTNHLPGVNHNIDANNIGGAKYNLNCATTAFAGGASGAATGLQTAFSFYGIIFQTQAVAGLSLMGMKVDTVQDVRRNTQFTVASMMKGTGVIRPELCRALVSASVSDANTTRANLVAHFNAASAQTAATAGTDGEAANNFTNGFGAEYAVTS
jgi:hypothetical protein